MGSFGKISFFSFNPAFQAEADKEPFNTVPVPQSRFTSAFKRLSHYFRQSAAASATAEAFLTPIMAQRAKIPQLMVTLIFKERNPCKHWSKCVSGACLSSMNS